MASLRSLMGSSLLVGDSTVPGATLPKKLKNQLPKIFQGVRDYGCDFYPAVVEVLRDDEISEIAAYYGFPVRYPHWKFGMEYEELQRGYDIGSRRISELVINTSPCYIYCLSSNTFVDNIMVVAHALGHNDFFKNNVYFSHTDTGMMNKMANNGMRIRKYMARWGKERVMEFIDHVLRLENLIDPVKTKRKHKRKVEFKDKRKYHHSRRFKVDSERDYMEDWINTEAWKEKERKRIKQVEISEQLELFASPSRDILGYLRDNAPLKPWQADIIFMLHEEAEYFSPQIRTKMMNEGWASKIDYEVLACNGMAALGQDGEDCGIVEYAKARMMVMGGKYSLNPYKLGFQLFQDIEERWNKGKFGTEWEECDNLKEKEDWDKKLGLGKEKIFEVRKCYDDFMAISEFFTEEFCNKNEFFEWEKTPQGEYVIISKDYKQIKKKLLRSYLNGGQPHIRLVDPNHRGRGIFLLEHTWDGRPLHEPYARAVMVSICNIWKNSVLLTTRDGDNQEIVYICDLGSSENNVQVMPREEYENNWMNS